MVMISSDIIFAHPLDPPTPRTTKTNNNFFGKEDAFYEICPGSETRFAFTRVTIDAFIVFLRYVSLCSCCAPLCRLLPLLRQLQTNHFLVYGIKNNGATQLYNPYDSSDNFFIGGIPFLGQTAQQGNNYDAFVGVFSVSNAQTSQSGDDNFGADIVAAKPLYAFLQGKSYTRTVGAPTCKMLQTT